MKNFKRPVPGHALQAMVVVAAGLLPTAVLSGEITLKSADGTVNVVGEFVDFRDNNYVVRTALGELRVAASRVRCDGADCPAIDTASAEVMIAGSETIGSGLMPLLMAGYASHQDAEITNVVTAREGEMMSTLVGNDGFGDAMGSYLVTSTTTDDAFAALKTQTAQIGMASRRIKPKEARDLKAAGAGNMVSPTQEHIFAVDSLVVITNPANPVTTLTMSQLRDIYSGEITNWSELGGADAPVTLVGRDPESGTNILFESNLFGKTGRTIGADLTVVPNDNMVAAAVNKDTSAIGFVGYAFQRGAKPVTLINDCGMPMTPDAFSAKTEEYGLQRRLYLYNRGDMPEGRAADFMSFVNSDAADDVITKAGFISLGITSRAQSPDSDRARLLKDPAVDAFEAGVMTEMLQQMVGFDRLSTTFRFRTGSSKLDERAVLDMQRLTAYLADQPQGTKALFVGFSDDVGAFESNRALSKDRAGQIMQAVIDGSDGKLANIVFDHTGYGEISPSACNVDEAGRGINRRVEVWIEKAAEPS